MIYLAHVSLDGRKQTVKEHCQNVADLCKQKTSTLECGNIGYLIGLLHDIGKLCSEFKEYLVGESNKRRWLKKQGLPKKMLRRLNRHS